MMRAPGPRRSLAPEEAACIPGVTLPVDGGRTTP